METIQNMTPLQTAQYMLNQDFFSQWMGIEILEVKEKYCRLQMPIRKEMINGLRTVVFPKNRNEYKYSF